MDTVVGINAGKACATCDTPPSCTHKYEIKGEKETYINFPEKHKTFEIINIISDKREHTLTSKLTPIRCISGKPNCPSTHIYSHESQEKFELGPSHKSSTYTIRSNAKLPEAKLPGIDIWDRIEDLFKSWNNSIGKIKYYSQTTDCSGLVQSTQINVYPQYTLSASFEINFENNVKDHYVAKRSDFTKEDVKKLKKELGVKKWSDINKYVNERKSTLEFKSEIKFFDEKYPYNFILGELNENIWNNKNSVTQKIRRLLDKVINSILKKAGGSFGIKDALLNGPNISAKGKKELIIVNSRPDFEYEWNLLFSPLIGLTITLDIINVIIAIFATPVTGDKWRSFRTSMEDQMDKLKDHKNRVVAGGLPYADLIISGEILNTGVSVLRKEQKMNVIGKTGSSLGLAIKIGFDTGARVFFVEGMLSTYGGGTAKISFDSICDSTGIGISFSHEGIKLIFKLDFKAGFSKEVSNKSISQSRGRGKKQGKGTSEKMTPINDSLIDFEYFLAEEYKSEPFYFYKF